MLRNTHHSLFAVIINHNINWIIQIFPRLSCNSINAKLELNYYQCSFVERVVTVINIKNYFDVPTFIQSIGKV